MSYWAILQIVRIIIALEKIFLHRSVDLRTLRRRRTMPGMLQGW